MGDSHFNFKNSKLEYSADEKGRICQSLHRLKFGQILLSLPPLFFLNFICKKLIKQEKNIKAQKPFRITDYQMLFVFKIWKIQKSLAHVVTFPVWNDFYFFIKKLRNIQVQLIDQSNGNQQSWTGFVDFSCHCWLFLKWTWVIIRWALHMK